MEQRDTHQEFETSTPQKQKSVWKVALIVFAIVLFLLVIGFLLFDVEEAETPEQKEALSSEIEEQDTDQRSEISEVTTADVVAGIQRKSDAFEALNPEFPDELIEIPVQNARLQGEVDPADEFIWDVVSELAITNRGLNRIDTFEVYFSEEDGTLASIQAQDVGSSTFLYSVNYISTQNFDELVRTIVHEHAHIYSLSDDQIRSSDEDPLVSGTCTTLLIDEGCTEQGNSLSEFYQRFWGQAQVDATKDLDSDEIFAYFEANETRFVNDYAATNPVEDYAESLMTYVFDDVDASSQLEKDQKALFFGDYPETRDYRLKVRAAMADW